MWGPARGGEALPCGPGRLGGGPPGGVVRSPDPKGPKNGRVLAHCPEEPLIADHPEIPAAVALQGFEGVRAYARDAEARTGPFLDALGFERKDGTTWETRGELRGGWTEYEGAPADAGLPGAGTVHHVAWASTMEDHEAWQRRVAEAGGDPTPIIDQVWFRSIYFREPSGVLFEIATLGPGFATDEDQAHLGEALLLPPGFEHLRAQVEPVLPPLPNPSESWSLA